MKLFKIAIAAAFALAATSAYAFHAGGVAECSGCHSMHSPAGDGTPGNGSFLLVGTDQSSACLSCHGERGQSSYHIATPDADLGAGVAPYNRTPGGDFGWLKKGYASVVRNNTTYENGESHGHNIIAADENFVADSRNTNSPGGNFPNSRLFCNACHDPHGKFRRAVGDTISTTGLPIKTSGSYANAASEPDATAAVGVYRLLAGNGYSTASGINPGYPGVPAAKVPNSYNRSEATSQIRVAYGVVNNTGGTTWGRWCGTCHGAMHSSGNYVHPVDAALGTAIAGNYNSYVMSGNMNGSNATAFSSLAPFATDAGATYATLTTAAASTAGPGTADQVNCLSCHRAHASGFMYMLRFDVEGTFITQNGAFVSSLTAGPFPKSTQEYQAAYYDRAPTAFASYQRVYCNKCHAKD